MNSFMHLQVINTTEVFFAEKNNCFNFQNLVTLLISLVCTYQTADNSCVCLICKQTTPEEEKMLKKKYAETVKSLQSAAGQIPSNH